ncbi:MAG: transglutaminase domain-containing protein [Lachnospirales bacterium]
MKRFMFFIIILLALILLFSFGLLKNKFFKSEIPVEEGYVVSESKNQYFSLSEKGDNIILLRGQVKDGTHSKIKVCVKDKERASIILQNSFAISDEAFEYEINMPENSTNAYIDLYYDEGAGLPICISAINAVNNGGKWKITENENTEVNNKILSKANKNSFLYSDSELKDIPQGIMVLSDTITKSHTTDYDKAYAIYLWLCEHIYIDENITDESLLYSYNTRICSTKSYANLFAAMLRVQGIPATITECEGGYVFNEIYVNNKWLNVQIDRDTFNKYISHQYIYNRKNVYTHFGVPNDIISANYIVNSQKK